MPGIDRDVKVPLSTVLEKSEGTPEERAVREDVLFGLYAALIDQPYVGTSSQAAFISDRIALAKSLPLPQGGSAAIYYLIEMLIDEDDDGEEPRRVVRARWLAAANQWYAKTKGKAVQGLATMSKSGFGDALNEDVEGVIGSFLSGVKKPLKDQLPALKAEAGIKSGGRRRGGMNGQTGIGSPGGLTIKVPGREPANGYLYGDETPQTLAAHTPPKPLTSPIPTMDGVKGIAADSSRRRTVGKITIPGKKGGKTRRGGNRSDMIVALMAIRDQIKVYHWQTSKYASHIATNDLVAALDKNIDEFVEVYMGKYGRPKIRKTIKLHNFSESAARAFVAQQTEFLTKKMPKMLRSTDSDLLNIRDTILADVNKTLYLFTLR
jgi:hypothetical protein